MSTPSQPESVSQPPMRARPPLPTAGDDLERMLDAVESRLAQLGHALRERDAREIESQAAELHRALALAVNRFAGAARQGGVPTELRRRLATASGEVAAQRESLARATAALDRAIDVLWPGTQAGAVYNAAGHGERAHGGAMIQA